MSPGFGGLPAPRSQPRLNGRKRVRAPARRVVIITEDGSTAKCTMPTRPRVRLFGRPVAPVLGDCVLDALAREWVLQLGGGHRHPVHEQAQVDSAPAGRVERQLPGHRQHVGVVEGGQVRRSDRGRA